MDVDLQSVKALADENDLLREEVRALRDQLLKKHAVEKESNYPPATTGDNLWQKVKLEQHQQSQLAMQDQAPEHSASSSVNTPSWMGKATNMPLGEQRPTHPPSTQLYSLLEGNSGVLTGQISMTALIRDRACQLGSWKSAGELEWRCKLHLADNYLAAGFTIRRPGPLQIQVTHSVRFIYNGETLGTARYQRTDLDTTETSAIVRTATSKFSRRKIIKWIRSSGVTALAGMSLLVEMAVAIQIHSIVVAQSTTESTIGIEGDNSGVT